VKLDVEIVGRPRRVELKKTADGWVATIDGRTLHVNAAKIGEWFSLLVAEQTGQAPDIAGSASRDPADSLNASALGRASASHEIAIEDRGRGALIVHVDGIAVPVTAIDPRRVFGRGNDEHGRSGGPMSIAAPMPGRIVKVLVKPGDHVTARQGLVVVEAMKMENELRAPADARVVHVRAVEGASVEANTVLVVLE